MIKLATILLAAIVIAGCASTRSQPVEIITQEMERTRLDLPFPSPISVTPVRWIIVTPDNIDAVWEGLESDGKHLVLFAITSEGYEELSMSMSEIRNYIATQRQIIVKYKEYYEPAQQEQEQ